MFITILTTAHLADTRCKVWEQNFCTIRFYRGYFSRLETCLKILTYTQRFSKSNSTSCADYCWSRYNSLMLEVNLKGPLISPTLLWFDDSFQIQSSRSNNPRVKPKLIHIVIIIKHVECVLRFLGCEPAWGYFDPSLLLNCNTWSNFN